ncbi:MAG: hypothetical protein GPJ08_16295 [Microcystis aeruginosa G13-09]|nr:hypothetical protein [Microcystis aeruginosa G13-09]
MILLEIPLATTPLLLFGNNAKAEPINEIILAQSKRCLEPGERKQITYQIEGIEREIKQLEDRIKELEKQFSDWQEERNRLRQLFLVYIVVYPQRNGGRRHPKDQEIRRDYDYAGNQLVSINKKMDEISAKISKLQNTISSLQRDLNLPDCVNICRIHPILCSNDPTIRDNIRGR